MKPVLFAFFFCAGFLTLASTVLSTASSIGVDEEGGGEAGGEASGGVLGLSEAVAGEVVAADMTIAAVMVK